MSVYNKETTLVLCEIEEQIPNLAIHEYKGPFFGRTLLLKHVPDSLKREVDVRFLLTDILKIGIIKQVVTFHPNNDITKINVYVEFYCIFKNKNTAALYESVRKIEEIEYSEEEYTIALEINLAEGIEKTVLYIEPMHVEHAEYAMKYITDMGIQLQRMQFDFYATQLAAQLAAPLTAQLPLAPLLDDSVEVDEKLQCVDTAPLALAPVLDDLIEEKKQCMSLYMPIIPQDLFLDGKKFDSTDITDFVENKLALGKVKRVDFIDRDNNRTVLHYAAFIHFDYWNEREEVVQFQKTLKTHGQYRIFGYGTTSRFVNSFGDNRYLVFKININPLQEDQIEPPSTLLHMVGQEKWAEHIAKFTSQVV